MSDRWWRWHLKMWRYWPGLWHLDGVGRTLAGRLRHELMWKDAGEAMTEALDWQRGTDPVWDEISPRRIFGYTSRPGPYAFVESNIDVCGSVGWGPS
jgi:hypothetical protein